MKDILSEIVSNKRVELEESRKQVPEQELIREAAYVERPVCSMSRSLASSSSGIIAEFKRKSPSRGWIHQDASPLEVIPAYQAGGASALSILTDSVYFGGSLDYIRQVRDKVSLPILRKDFIIDSYQLFEARVAGADAVLLIAACLDIDKCRELIEQAHSLGLEVLMELHSEQELPYALLGADMVGINNRNLGTFVTDYHNSFRMANALREQLSSLDRMPVMVSESGISSPDTVRELREAGFGGFLMGENFMKEAGPGQALSDFIAAL